MRLRALGGITFVLIAGFSQSAMAAKQCLSVAGTYGNVSVTGCDNDPANGILNPIMSIEGNGLPVGYSYDGLALGGLPANLSCTYNFSHSIATNSITVDLDGLNTGDQFSVELDGQPYTFTPSDIVQTPLPPVRLSDESVAAMGGAIQNAPGTDNSSGTVGLLSSAPARVSSLTLKMNALGYGSVTRVCLDDTALPSPVAPTPVPTNSEWGLLLISALLGMFGIARMRKRHNG